MKQPLLLVLFALATYFYFQNSGAPAPAVAKADVARPSRNVASQSIVIASAPSYSERWKSGPNAQNEWKTGPTAQNDWKTGPNAQTNFEPFAPSEQTNWYENPGYTIVTGAKIRR